MRPVTPSDNSSSAERSAEQDQSGTDQVLEDAIRRLNADLVVDEALELDSDTNQLPDANISSGRRTLSFHQSYGINRL